MTFHLPQRAVRLCQVVSRIGGEMIARARPSAESVPRPRLARVLTIGLLLQAGCTPTTYSITRDPPDYVDRVLEDVTAIIEGMANAHAGDRIVYRDPGIRSSVQPGLN